MQAPMGELPLLFTRNNTRIHKTSKEVLYFYFHKLFLQSMIWLENIRAKIPCRATTDVKDNKKSLIIC